MFFCFVKGTGILVYQPSDYDCIKNGDQNALLLLKPALKPAWSFWLIISPLLCLLEFLALISVCLSLFLLQAGGYLCVDVCDSSTKLAK